MSFEIIKNLRKMFKVKGFEMSAHRRLMMLTLVSYADADGSSIFPSDTALSEMTGMGRTGCCRIKNDLIKDEWFIVEKAVSRRPKVLKFNLGKLASILEEGCVKLKEEEPKEMKAEVASAEIASAPEALAVCSGSTSGSASEAHYINHYQLIDKLINEANSLRAQIDEPLMGNGFAKQKEEEHPGKQPEEKASKTFEQGPPKNSPLDLSAEERDNYDLVKMLRSMDVFDGQIRKILPEYGPEKIRGAIAVTKEAWLAGKIKTTRGAYMMHYLKNGSRY